MTQGAALERIARETGVDLRVGAVGTALHTTTAGEGASAALGAAAGNTAVGAAAIKVRPPARASRRDGSEGRRRRWWWHRRRRWSLMMTQGAALERIARETGVDLRVGAVGTALHTTTAGEGASAALGAAAGNTAVGAAASGASRPQLVLTAEAS